MLIYDLHCHLLPGLDDGAFLSDESLLMAEMAAKNGTRTMVCTPHWMPGGYTQEELLRTYRDLAKRMGEAGIPVKLALGQEILMDESYRTAADLLEKERLLTINRTRYPLIEFDPFVMERTACGIVSCLRAKGFVPIVAHPERYAFTDEDRRALDRLHAAGALLQINKGSITGFFGRDAQRTADYMLRERLADFAASDAHSPYRRTPGMADVHEYVSEYCSPEYADHIFSKNPLRVLKNEIIYFYHH